MLALSSSPRISVPLTARSTDISGGHHVGAGPLGQRIFDVRRGRDDGAPAAALDELDGRADLWPHAPFGKLARVEMASGLGHRDAVEEALPRRAEAHRDLLDAGREHEDGGAEMRGQVARGEVLVHHGLHATVHAWLLLDDRNAATSARNHEKARV